MLLDVNGKNKKIYCHPLSYLSRYINDKERKLTKDFTEKQLRLWDAFIFLSSFSLFAASLHLIIWSGYDFRHMIEITSIATSSLLSLTDINYYIQGNTFFIDTKTGLLIAEIIRDCVGWKSFLALSGLMIATRHVTLKSKLIGIIFGLLAIFAGNIIRLFTTFYITSKEGLEYFDMTHNILWQGGLIFLVVSIWWIWMKTITNKERYI